MRLVTILLVLAAVLPAQQGNDPGRQRIEQEIDSMRKRMQEGKFVRMNVRVTVRLKNQNKIIGVVRNGRFVERPEGLEFVEADRRMEGAGIRVWYHDKSVSCLFLPYDEIESYTIGQKLTEAQVKEIEERIERERQKQEEQRHASAEKTPAGGEAGSGTEPRKPDGTVTASPSGAETKPLPADAQQLLALVTEFPPEKGWSVEKAAQLEKKKITLGVFPSTQEKRFLDVLESWKKGVALKREIDASKEVETGAKAAAKPAK